MKTFVFFIGGSGARVLRALTMMMASGVSLKDGDSIVPILVDFDATNADLKRAHELLGLYNEFHKIGDYEEDQFKGGFFRTLLGLKEKGSHNTMNPLVRMAFEDDKNTFGQYIGYESLENLQDRDGNRNVCKPTKLLIDALYDSSSPDSRDRELNLELRYGFKGNPNIGSVVFNEYFKTGQFQAFKDNFSPGDRIFIVASIFGGTGSSGLPQLVKKIRESMTQQLDNNGTVRAIREAMLGACVVLPYFKVKENSESAINSLTFNSKAKAALNYYHDEINHVMSEVFYIGCNKQNTGYENIEGGEKQENKAHLVELLAAMSIMEFAGHPEMASGEETKYYEYTSTSSPEDLPNPSFLNLLSRPNGEHVYQTYVKKLNSFAMAAKYFRDYTRKEEKKLTSLTRSSYYKNLEDFLHSGKDFSEKFYDFTSRFIEWIDEMKENSIYSFCSYNFNAKSLSELILMDDTNNFKKTNSENTITTALNDGCAKENDRNSKGDKVYLRHVYNGCIQAVGQIN